MRTVLLIIFCLCAGLLPGQTGEWTYFAPTAEVTALAAQGNTILVGTEKAGIVRYDTLQNRSYYTSANSNSPSDTIRRLAIDAQGHWWMHTPGRVSRYDGATWQTWTFTDLGLTNTATVNALKAAPDSSLYVATNQGVTIFDNNAWSLLNTSNSSLPSNSVWDVAFGPDGKIYYATSTTGLVVQDGATWTAYTTANTGVPTFNSVFAVAVQPNGTVWATGGISNITSIRLAKFEAGVWTAYTTATIGLTGSGPVFYELVTDAAGRLWLTTPQGVSMFDNGNWTHFSLNDELLCSGISASNAAPAFAGTQTWVHLNCGAAIFDGQTWDRPATGLPGPPVGVFYDGIGASSNGDVWCGTEFSNGLVTRYSANTWEQYYLGDYGPASDDVYSIKSDLNGGVWFGLSSGELLRYNNGAWQYFDTCKTYFDGYLSRNVASAPNGDQWFSFLLTTNVSAGFARYSASGEWQFFTAQENPLLVSGGDPRKMVVAPNGTLWVATTFRGILRYDGTTWDTLTISNSDLPTNRVRDLAWAPDGALWATTTEGLVRFDGQNWTTFNTSNSGLPSNDVSRLAFDQEGGLYVGFWRPQGVPGTTMVVLRDGVWTEITPPGWENTVNEAPDAMMVDAENRLWFAEFTGPGVYRFDPMLVKADEPQSAALQGAVSPNPSAGVCVLQLKAPLPEPARLSVWDTRGQMVVDYGVVPAASTSLPIDLTTLPVGAYWIRLQGPNGRLISHSVVKR